MKYLLTRHAKLRAEFKAEFGHLYAKDLWNSLNENEVSALFSPGDIVYGVIPDWLKDYFDDVGDIEYHDTFLHKVTGHLVVKTFQESRNSRRRGNLYQPV